MNRLRLQSRTVERSKRSPADPVDSPLESAIFDTDLGWFGAAMRYGKLARLTLPAESPDAAAQSLDQPPSIRLSDRNLSLKERLQQQLNEYARRQRQEFDLPLSPEGTLFQQGVWRELLKIPSGETATYRDVAAGIGKPRAARAVGQAVAANPIAIVVPCHRVVRTGGAIGGYAGGTQMKAQLLTLESRGQPEARLWV